MIKVNGFTIIELLVYISITTVALTVFTSFVADVTKNAARSKITTEVQQNARLLLTKITQDIRNGQNITVPMVSKITLQKAGITISYNWNGSNKTVEYQEGGGTVVTISNNNVNVSSLSFEKINDIITVSLVVEQRDNGNSPAYKDKITLSSTVVSRQGIYN